MSAVSLARAGKLHGQPGIVVTSAFLIWQATLERCGTYCLLVTGFGDVRLTKARHVRIPKMVRSHVRGPVIIQVRSSHLPMTMLAGSSGYVGSEEFVENREAAADPVATSLGQVKQMHAWTSPATTPRGCGECIT